ncbi:MAG: PD-(D/E)XK nuclease family protein [Terriglobia bacterium]
MNFNATRLDTFEKCNRLYFWKNVFDFGGEARGMQPHYQAEPLKFGEVVHLGLAAYYRGVRGAALLKQYREEALLALDFDSLSWEQKNLWLDNLDWIDRILTQYELWAAKNDDFKVLAVEVEGSIALSDAHHLVFRQDLIVEQNDVVKVIDHKTAKSVSAPYLQSWHYSPQMWGYSLGAQIMGRDVRGYGINIIRKLVSAGEPEQTTKICPDCRNGARKKPECLTCKTTGRVEKTNNPSATLFQREWASWTPAKAQKIVEMRLRTIEDIEREAARFESDPRGAYPMKPSQCFSFGICPFVRVCWDWGLKKTEKWYEPPIELLESFDPQPLSYVESIQTLVKEEAK